MKLLLPLLALCFLPLIFGVHLKRSSSSTTTCCVTVYEDVGYKGANRQFCGNVGFLGDYGWNDRISSWKSNCSPRMYSDAYGKGAVIVKNEYKDLREPCMSFGRVNGVTQCVARWNDQISSIYF